MIGEGLTAITRMGSYTLMLCVHPSIPAKSVKELIEYAKANPGKLSFASGNTSGVVAGETLKHWAEIDMLHVPYKSAPPALNDVMAGRVSMMFTDLTTGLPQVKAGNLRALAVTRLKRSTLIHELPTMDEAGVTGFDMDSGPVYSLRPARPRTSSRFSTRSCARSSTARR
jgi:tripartite-type tricarboxylate transporter receptor subunit TctC